MRTPTNKAIRLVQAALGGMVIRVEKVNEDDDSVRTPVRADTETLFDGGTGQRANGRDCQIVNRIDP